MFEDYHLVIYTDGSASPNPGYVGSASHGYIYHDIEPKKHYELYDSILTDKGYIHKSTYDPSMGKPVEPLYFIEQNSSYDIIGSNNIAELLAVKQIFEWLNHNNMSFKSILIYSDSNYVVSGINDYHGEWIENEWLRKDKKEISNKDVWKETIDLWYSIKTNNQDIQVKWLKGHSSHLGNQLADFASKIARFNSHNGIYQYKESIADAKEYFNGKVELNPMICYNNVVISNRPNQNESGVYYLYKSNLEDHLIGKANSETSYAIIYLKEPERIIEQIKTRQEEARIYDAILLAKVDKFKIKNYYDRIKNSVFNSLLAQTTNDLLILSDPYSEGNSFNNKNTDSITTEINPPQLLSSALDHYSFLYDLLFALINGKGCYIKYKSFDITEQFYKSEIDKKQNESLILREEFVVGYKEHILDISLNEKKVRIPLILGLDMPDRNVLKRIEKKHPKVELILIESGKESFGYCVYIQDDDGYGIWDNRSASRIFF